MKKAALIIDLPENCRDCQFFGYECALLSKPRIYIKEICMEFFAVLCVIAILMSIFGDQIIAIIGLLLLIIIVKIAIKIISWIINDT